MRRKSGASLSRFAGAQILMGMTLVRLKDDES